MHADDEHLLVVAAIEDRDAAALGQMRRRAPQKVVRELALARLLERRDVQAARVHAGEDVADRAVLAGRIECLKDEQHGIAAVGDRADTATRRAP